MILITADLHLSANPRDAYRFAAMEYLAELIIKNKVEALIILGDLTEEKNYHSAVLANDVVELLYNLSCLCQVIVLRGNHDYTDVQYPFFHFVRRIANVRWVNHPSKHLVVRGTFLFLPHTSNYERDWKGLDLAKSWDNLDMTFAHNTFEGASSEHGHRLHGIPTSVFPKGVKVVSGDIHTPQTFGSITYVGAPYTVDFGDDYAPRVLLMPDDGKLKSLPMVGPQKRLVELEGVDTIANLSHGLHNGDIVKVRYKLASDEREEWPDIKARIRKKLTEFGCVPFLIQPVLDSKKKKATPSTKRLKSDDEIVQGFGKLSKVSEPTMKTGLDLLKKA